MQPKPSNDATSVARVDMKFEIVVIPVSDVDRVQEFVSKNAVTFSASAKGA